MIAPRLRLVLVMLFVTVPLATAAGLSPGLWPIALLIIGLALVITFFDLAFGLNRHRDLNIALSEVVRGTLAERAELEIQVMRPTRKSGRMRVSARFPDGL